MTIISVHITDKSLLAVADGLISNNSPARVLEENKKIIIFEPRYKVPRVGLGRFNYFSEYSAGNFGIGYAGNLSLISSTLNDFQEVVRNQMFLDRNTNNGGKPQIYRQRNFEDKFKGNSYYDEYNFSHDELPAITVSLLVNILMSVSKNTCLDFYRSAMKEPDMHFIVFGEQMEKNDRCVRCEVIRIFGVDGENLRFQRYSILPNEVAIIGEKKSSELLMKSIYDDSKFITPPDDLLGPISHKMSCADEFLQPADIFNFELRNKKERDASTWARIRSQVMKLKTLNIIEKETSTIGGDSTVAEIGFAQQLRLSVIRREQLEAEIKKLEQMLS